MRGRALELELLAMRVDQAWRFAQSSVGPDGILRDRTGASATSAAGIALGADEVAVFGGAGPYHAPVGG